MTKTELINVVNKISKALSSTIIGVELTNDLHNIRVLEAKIMDIIPNAVLEKGIKEDVKRSSIEEFCMQVYIDEYYTGKFFDKDMLKLRPKFEKLDSLHKGIELFITIDKDEMVVSAGVVADYTIHNGYKEKNDAVILVEKGYFFLTA